jgi:glutathione S-transferase
MSSNSSLKPLVLHSHATGPNPYKVAIALEMLHLPYTVIVWDFGDDPKKGVKGEKFLAINENGRVPALEDPNTGVVSWESQACLNYLERVYDKNHVLGLPDNASEQDKVDFDKWNSFLISTLGPMMGQLNWYKAYNATKNEDALKRYDEQTKRTFGVLEAQLKKSGGKSVLPKGFSMVDVQYYPWIVQWDYPAGLNIKDYPTVEKWFNQIEQMDEVKKAYEKVKNGEHA